jgi:hypothetical protein
MVAGIPTVMFLWQTVWATEGRTVMSQFTPDQRREIMARARATLAETAPAAQRRAIASRRSEPELVYKTRVTNDDERPRPRVAHEARANDGSSSSSVERAPCPRKVNAKDASKMPWTDWVDARLDYERSVMTEALGGVLGEFRAQAREHCEREVGIVARELELTRREFAVLQKEVGVERGLRKLQDDVAEARKLVPEVPAIAARLDAEQSSLKAEQARLQREIEATTKKVGRLRVDQSIADYSISELRKEAEASKVASIAMETSTSRFMLRNIDPVAARTLRDFAAHVIDARDGGAVWLSGPAGTA